VTNYYVVDGAESLEIILADGTTLPANLVGMDIYADLAVLHVVAKCLLLLIGGTQTHSRCEPDLISLLK